jgi:hypothetical protein
MTARSTRHAEVGLSRTNSGWRCPVTNVRNLNSGFWRNALTDPKGAASFR